MKRITQILTLTLSLVLVAGSLQAQMHEDKKPLAMDEGVKDQILLLQTLDETAKVTSQSTAHFFKSLGLQTKDSHNLTIKIYSDYQKMRKDAQVSAAKDINMLGYFEHSNHEIGVWYGGNMEETQRILRHEIIHDILHESLKNTPPAWLDEGLAEFLSRNPDALKDMNKSAVNLTIKSVLQTAQQSGNVLKIEDLFQLNHDNFYGPQQDLRYATSYAVIAYLYNQEGPRVLGSLLLAIDSGEDVAQWLKTRIFSNQKEDPTQTILNWATSQG